MPIRISDDSDTQSSPTFAGPVSDLTVSPLAPPTIATNPTAGQGVALDSSGRLPTSAPATAISVYTSDPDAPVVGQMWYRSDTSQLCVRHDATTTKRVLLA